MITKPSLGDVKDTAGVVGTPVYAGDTTIIATQSADTRNSDSDLNQSASSENLSAKFKNGAQDVPAKGRGQYEEAK